MSLTASTAPAPRITYGAVLGSPHVARLLGGTLTGRLPNGMAPSLMIERVQASGGVWVEHVASGAGAGFGAVGAAAD